MKIDLKIGSEFFFGGTKLLVVKGGKCQDCYFYGKETCEEQNAPACSYRNREDKKSVIFIESNLPEIDKDSSSCKTPQPTNESTKKNDRKDHKLRWELLPMAEIEDLVKVYTFGALKYAPNSWQDLPDGTNRYRAAALRHLCEFSKGNPLDNETHLPHLAHLVWNAVAMLYLWKKENPGLAKQSEEEFKKLIETIDTKEETNG